MESCMQRRFPHSAENRLLLAFTYHPHNPAVKKTLPNYLCRSGLTMLSRHTVGTYQGNALTLTLSGNSRPQSSQLAETLWTDPGVKSGISVSELNLH